MRLFYLITLALAATIALSARPEMTRSVLFEGGKDGYFTYRIPGLVATKEGTLLAFASARQNSGHDWHPIDVVMRRSADGGKTWEPMRVIVDDGDLPCDNPMPIVDYVTGDVHLLYQIDYDKCFYTKSSDDGLTWDEPVEITKTIEAYKETYPWVVMAPGPGHGIQMANGRLVVPFWLSDGTAKEFGPEYRGHRPSVVVSVYSDDHGKTWQAGEIAIPDTPTFVVPSETALVELADGRVMFNARNESINYRRIITYSEDGATDWSEPYFHDAFFEPICFGSMVRYSMKPYQSKNRILFCNPDSRHNPWVRKPYLPHTAGTRLRENLTVRMSYDEGDTWPVRKVIDPNIAGYSDMAVTANGKIHLLYEGGILKGHASHVANNAMTLVSFDLEWLTEGADALDPTDEPLNQLFEPSR